MDRLIKQRRVVVTGIGILSPLGNTLETAWQNLAAGKTGIAPIQRFDASNLEVRFAGEVKDFNPEDYMARRDVRRTDRAAHMAIAAAKDAVLDSGLVVDDHNHYDVGCLVGTGIGGLESQMATARTMIEKGPNQVSPFAITSSIPDSACTQISMQYDIRGPVFSLSTACATGNNSIGEATEIIRRGAARVMLAGSTEAGVVDVSIASFNNIMALSRRNAEPERASRPFDKERDGFVVGEGAAVLVLEDLDYALERGAKIYAEILGYGHTSDAFHITAPRETGESAARAITVALENAGVTAEQLDYINAHGTSTPLNDKSETTAIKLALGAQAYNIPISSTKSATGHLLAGAGAVEAVFTLMAIRNNFIPPTLNLDNPDPECDLNYTPKVGVQREVNIAISNAFGFGGHNAVLVFGKYA